MVCGGRLSRRKEAEGLKLTAFPKSAAEYESWIDSVIAKVQSAATGGDVVYPWIVKTAGPDTKFDEVSSTGGQSSMGSKVRHGIMHHAGNSDTAAKHQELADLFRSETKGLQQ